MKIGFTYFLFITILLTGCKNKKERWVNKFTKAFQENTIRNDINWIEFKNSVAMAYDTSIYLAIERGLTINGNKHSQYRINRQTIYGDYPIDTRHDYCSYDRKAIESKVPQNLGYIKIKSLGLRPELSKKRKEQLAFEYISEVQEKIEMQSNSKLKGWIIDLRFNNGGNMWPMLISLRPFLNQGTLGFFVSDEEDVEWSLKDKNIMHGKYSMNRRFIEQDYSFENIEKDLPIAVLIGKGTSSSGEAVAIALQSLKNMKYFGDSTSGFSTANRTVKIVKDEYLIITASTMANFKGEKIPEGIKVAAKTCDDGALLSSVVSWINGARQ